MDPPDNQSLARDLFSHVLVCFLISLLGFCCFGVLVARACPRSARQLLHYALLSSGVVCRLLSPWTLISIVSGLRDSLPFSSFSGSFLECEREREHRYSACLRWISAKTIMHSVHHYFVTVLVILVFTLSEFFFDLILLFIMILKEKKMFLLITLFSLTIMYS